MRPKSFLGWLNFIWALLSLLGFIVSSFLLDKIHQFEDGLSIAHINWSLFGAGFLLLSALIIKHDRTFKKTIKSISFKDSLRVFFGVLLVNIFFSGGVIMLFMDTVHFFNSTEKALFLTV